MFKRRKILLPAQAPGFGAGQALIISIIFLAVIATTSSAILGYVGSVARFEKITGEKKLALQIAQAGLDKAIWCLNQTEGTNCGGTFGGDYTGETSASMPPGEFTTSVTSIDASTKEITSTGFIPDSANPVYQKTIKARAVINTTDVNFSFGVQTGGSGLTMDPTSVVQGSVYSNGPITGSENAQITGDAYVASDIADTPAESWTTTNNDFSFGQGTPQTDIAQSFVPSSSGTMNQISFYIRKTGSPTDRTVRIVSDNSNKPSKTTLETGTLLASQVTSSYGWINIALDDVLPVNSGTRYWIIIDAVNNTNNYWQIASDSPGGYASGKGMYSPDWNAGQPVWTNADADFNFKVWFTGETGVIDTVEIGGDAHANTIRDSEVTGDAYYQTIVSTTVTGNSYPGSTDPAPTAFPISDSQINEWKSDASVGDPIIGDVHPAKDENISLGPVKITGNLILDDGQTLTVTGTIYVQGNIDVGNKGSIVLAPEYGTNSGMVISDGWMHFENNGSFQGAGPGSYLMLLSTASGGGHDNSVMDLHNNVVGVMLFAPNGFVNLHNGVRTTQITADRIHLSNGATLAYEIGISNVNFSSGPGGSWQFQPGSWRITN